MGRFLYIADWHYGHANAIGFDNRPFLNAEEMNRELVKRWNEVVRQDDRVFVLGDMFWCKETEAAQVLARLNGRKTLVKGNHDRCRDDQFVKCFDQIVNYIEIVDNNRNVVLCHYPIPCFKNHFYGWFHLYGHVHNSFEWNMMENTKKMMTELYGKQCQMFNVGVMMNYMNYTPRTLDEILEQTQTDDAVK